MTWAWVGVLLLAAWPGLGRADDTPAKPDAAAAEKPVCAQRGAQKLTTRCNLLHRSAGSTQGIERRAASPTLTGFSPIALDPKRVAALVEQRLDTLSARALADLLESAGAALAVGPATDFTAAVVGLLRPTADVAAARETLARALVRTGLAAVVARVFTDGDCTDVRDRWDAAYEALGDSAVVWSLGFAETDRKPPEGCEVYAVEIAELIDVLVVSAHVELAAANPGRAMKDAFAELDRWIDAAAPPRSPSSPYGEAPSASSGEPCTRPPRDVRDARCLLALGKASITPTWALAEALTAARRYERVLSFVDPSTSLAEFERFLDALVAPSARHRDWARIAGMLARVFDPTAAPASARVTKGEVLILATMLRATLEDVWADRKATTSGAAEATFALVVELVERLPDAMVEDPDALMGLRFDASGLARQMLADHRLEERAGMYLRATVGLGYLSMFGRSDIDWAPLAYEQLGFGYRWWAFDHRVLAGPHLMASGVLHRFVLDEVARNATLVGLGWAVNLYQTIDVTLDVGFALGTTDEDLDGQPMMAVGVQIPLLDYLADDEE